MTCPVCGTVPVPAARFCHHCGAALPAAATLPATERRVVTVLFGDLSDFTSWSEELDPERVGAVTDRVLSALAGAVKTFGGHVDKLTGDGIMAVFGAPVAHEDDAERAVRAALSMQRAVRRVLDDERGGSAPTGLRLGVNTGPVVAGVQAGLEYTVIGDTVNTAARLADAAAVGAVYAGARTVAATQSVAGWRTLRPLRLKGKREPVETYELLGLHDARGTRAGLGEEGPFVGREAELGRVAGRLAEVVDRDEPRVLVFTAEAGIGKSRFASEVERFANGYEVSAGRFASRTQARVLSVRCAAYGERRRLAPLADLVRLAVGLPADPNTAVTRQVAEERLRRLTTRLTQRSEPGRPVNVDVDALLALLGYADPNELAQWHGVSGDDPEQPGRETAVLAVAVARLLDALATESPLVVIVDDLHDGTPETLDALGFALEELTGPALVILLGRPELVRRAGQLTRVADAEATALPPLRGADAARLLTAYLKGGRLPQADEDRLLTTAQGNPFYLAELVTLLMERGALTKAGAQRGLPAAPNSPGWRLTPGSLDATLLSRDLAAVLAARIDALPVEARAVLRDAAVVGDSVPAGALEALRERRSSRDGRPAAVVAVELERAVDELLQRRMLRRVRGGFAFATPLLREAAYAGVGKADLADRHAFLARWAAPGQTQVTVSSGRTVPALAGVTDDMRDSFVADHAERATRLADAVRLRPDVPARQVAPLGVAALGRAARRAGQAGEPAEAVAYGARAARLAPGALPLPDRLVHARSLLQYGRIAEALHDAEKLIADAADDPRVRAGALLLAGRGQVAQGDPDHAYRSWSEALKAATDADLPGERAEAMRRMGMADFLSGRLGDASSRFAGAYQIAVSAGDRKSQAWSLQNLAWVTTTRGDFAGADAALARAARLFAETRDPVGRAWLRGTTAFARLLAGRLTEAQRLAHVFLPFGERVGEAWAVGTLRAVAAFAAAELGELGEADREARRAYRDFAAAKDVWGRGFALVARGVVARGLGEYGHAEDLLAEALEEGEKVGHPLLVGMAGTVRGFVALDRGDCAAAETDARSVLTMVSPYGVLDPARVGPRALLAAARLAAGDAPMALRLLAPIAAAPHGPSMLYSRRQGIALYSEALLADGQVAAALSAAELAQSLPAVDVRSRVRSAVAYAKVLAAAGRDAEAVEAAAQARTLAEGTQQASERSVALATWGAVSEGRSATV
ncbi:adenylate/guanylate cyclase domain-containing protein [Catellatospora sp. KI3]|uniref:adenylate/guanylate cyclase domain-containing protein n=1 Tax=Catellatospora sp. KI3 TaxID=3041620 RepID=UPI00248264B6|nr:adenylate/guanylate cyclase domain-containing protein [Catellatospora sp. KI3]MDI1465060.1 adenylate/guanylate cyclase domain-containing protein [Catellatospora sp. KI3]